MREKKKSESMALNLQCNIKYFFGEESLSATISCRQHYLALRELTEYAE